MSGPANMERLGLEALLAYAREGDTLAVVRLDRLGRSLAEVLGHHGHAQRAWHRPDQPGRKDRTNSVRVIP